MKLLSSIVFMLFVINQSVSQVVDKTFEGSYTSMELEVLQKKDPSTIEVLTFGLENATYVADLPEGKQLPGDTEIELPEGEFTFVDLGLKILDQNQYIKIKGSNQMLVVKSMWVLRNELNTSKK